MSGAADFSQVVAASMRALMPLMFQVAIFMGARTYNKTYFVMPGLVPGIHDLRRVAGKSWIAGPGPAMTGADYKKRRLNRETSAAAATGRDVRVVDLELRADQVVDEVNLAALHEGERDRIDHDTRAVSLDQHVVRRALGDEIEAVLEPRAAAALDAHSEQRGRRLAGNELGDAGCRTCAQGDGRFTHLGCSQFLLET